MFHDHSRRPCAVHYVFRPCSRLLFISISDKMATLHSLADLPVLVPFHGLVAMTRCDVDVSIIGQTATFHSSTDLPVSLPLYNLVVEASDDSMTRCGCGCLHHRPDGHLPLLHGPAGLIAVVRSRSRSPNAVHTASLYLRRCDLHHRQDGHPPLVHGPAGLVHCSFNLLVEASHPPPNWGSNCAT
jgi:hypothetical protein